MGFQNSRQLNRFEQTVPLAGENYKFNMIIESRRFNSTGSEVWFLEGCFPTNTDYSDADYAINEPVTVSLTIRYDNAIHEKGTSSIVDTSAGDPFTKEAPGAAGPSA